MKNPIKLQVLSSEKQAFNFTRYKSIKLFFKKTHCFAIILVKFTVGIEFSTLEYAYEKFQPHHVTLRISSRGKLSDNSGYFSGGLPCREPRFGGC